MPQEERAGAPPLPTSTRIAVERTFATFDGTELFYRFWPSIPAASKGAIVLFHRGHEHGGRMAHLVDELDHARLCLLRLGCARQRPLGRRARLRAVICRPGARHRLFRRARSPTRTVSAAQDIALIAQSFGAVLAAAWVHDYAPNIRALVLASPAFSVKLYVPFAKQGIALLAEAEGPLLRQFLRQGEVPDATIRSASPPSTPTR